MKLCCYAVDMLRSCYSTTMQFSNSPNAPSIRIQWFFADDLPFVPGGTHYGSTIWRGEGELPNAGIGEVVGANKRWENGANPDPFCCDPPRFLGGAIAGGSAGHWVDFFLTGLGGILLDGAGTFGAGFTGLGGVMLDGAGEFSYGIIVSDSDRIGIRITDSITTPTGVADSDRIGIRITDLVDFNPFDVLDSDRIGIQLDDSISTPSSVADSDRIGIRITDLVGLNPFPVADSDRIGIRITDLVSINPFSAADSDRIGIRITDLVTTH